jgi:hypothetical protein
MARWNQPVSPDELLDQLLAAADPNTIFSKDGLIEEWASVWADDIIVRDEIVPIWCSDDRSDDERRWRRNTPVC